MRHISEMEQKQMAFTMDNKPAFDKLHVAGMVKKTLEANREDKVSPDSSDVIANKSILPNPQRYC